MANVKQQKKTTTNNEVKDDLFKSRVYTSDNKTKIEKNNKTKSIDETSEATQKVKTKRIKPKLSGKHKFWYIFLCIITLSIFYFYIQNKIEKANNKAAQSKIKKQEQETETKKETKPKSVVTSINKSKETIKKELKEKESNKKVEDTKVEKTSKVENLKVSDKVGFNIDQLIEYLGGIDNIDSVDGSLSSLKVMVKDKTKIKQEEIKKLGAKGLIVSNLKVSILFGDNSMTIKKLIEQQLSK